MASTLEDLNEEQMMQYVRDEVLTRMDQAMQYYARSLDVPEVKFHRNVTRAGQAYGRGNWVEFNIGYLMSDRLEDRIDMIEETIPHEVAHIIVYQLWSKAKPHGEEWQKVMRTVFRIEPQRTHGYCERSAKQTVRRQRQWTYACDCDSPFSFVNTTKKNRIESMHRLCDEHGSSAGYKCRKCKARIRLIGESPR